VDSDTTDYKKLSLRFNSVLREEGGTKVPVTNIVIHPYYAAVETEGNDLAILVLADSVPLETVTLNSDRYVPESGGNVYGKWIQFEVMVLDASVNIHFWTLAAVGFGATNDLGCLAEEFQGAPMSAMELCPVCYLTPIDNDNVLCINVTTATDCFGDSGGPLLDGGSDSNLQVGISSFIDSYFCSRATFTAFTRVSTYYDWIQGQICANSGEQWKWCEGTWFLVLSNTVLTNSFSFLSIARSILANPPANCTTTSLAKDTSSNSSTKKSKNGILGTFSRLIAKSRYRFRSIHWSVGKVVFTAVSSPILTAGDYLPSNTSRESNRMLAFS
jgi:secreted trypsin-like serine protease